MPPSTQHIRWSDIPVEQLNPSLQRQFVSGTQATIARLHLKKGVLVPTHSHINEQIATVLEGALQFTLDPDGTPEIVTVHAGELLIIAPNQPHSALALEDTLNIDFFTPIRQDWIDGADAYLR